MAAKNMDSYEKFTQLYVLYSQSLIGLAASIVKSIDIAEELVHDVYEKIYKKIDIIDDPQSSRTKKYLMTAVRNQCYYYLHNHIFMADLTEQESLLANPLDDVWEYFSVKEIQKKLVLFLETLHDEDRLLFIDAALKGYPYKELAEKYQITEQNIRVKVFRLRTRLRKLFDEE